MTALPDYQYKPLEEPDSIRLVRLLPSRDVAAIIECKMIHTTLSMEASIQSENGLAFPEEGNTGGLTPCNLSHIYDARGYTALSYTWGSPEKPCTIVIDNQKFNITKNLEDAMRNLRRKTDSEAAPRLWIDSLCIDQSSDQERSHQVQQMCSIYQTAHSTVIYLGPATRNSKACFAAARDTERFEKDPLRKIMVHNYPFGNDQPDYSYAHDLTSDILSRSWFTRSWTFQELVVSKRPWVCCGSTSIPWTQLCIYILGAYRWNPMSGPDGYARDQYFMHLSNSGGLFSEHIVDRLSLEYAITEYYPIKWDKELGRLRATGKCMQNLDKARQLFQARGNKLSDEIRLLQEKFTLSSLLEHRRGSAASDPRDTVFSLYGIIDESYPSQQCVPVDYERAAPEIFTDVAAAILMSAPAPSLADSEDEYPGWAWPTVAALADSYSMFSHVNNNSMSTVPDLPSWVPDWSSPRSYQRSIRNSVHEYFPAISWTSSLPQVSCDRRVYREDKVVVCRGSSSIDQIVALSNVMLSHK
ncbi:hypothetical protein ACEPPN_016617 [Leptodophora sp. 'Broadleaf-Isolate-01']